MQETWLRWDGIGADGQAEVADSRAYLVRIVTRQALNRLRTLARRKEEYVGEWLPEPLLTTPDVAEDVELAESVSMAMLTVLETLTPTERAVFVLREVFALPFEESPPRRASRRLPSARLRTGRGRMLRRAGHGWKGPCRAAAGSRPLPHGPADRRFAGADGRIGARRSPHRGRRWPSSRGAAAGRRRKEDRQPARRVRTDRPDCRSRGRSSSTAPRAPASSSTTPSTRWSALRSRTDGSAGSSRYATPISSTG
ncbi:MAG: polymerase sigma-70 factor [Geminicoccaceae bacterium]|nr:polymerase sigma-70 factor [Geminicoccaceae bacterium]